MYEITHTISDIEAFWLVVATAGTFLNARYTQRSIAVYTRVRDAARVPGLGVNDRDVVSARGNVRRNIQRLVCQVLLFGIGIDSAFIQNKPITSWHRRYDVGAIIAVELLMVWAAWRDDIDRRQIRRLWRKSRVGDPTSPG